MSYKLGKPFRKYALIFALFVISQSSAADSLGISNAWIKNLPPVVPMRAGYLTIKNHSSQLIKIIAAESELFMQIEIHENIEKNGMMSMQPVSSLSVQAGETVELSQGGIHLMMMHPKVTLKPGDEVEVSLHFDDGNTQTLQMTVRK